MIDLQDVFLYCANPITRTILREAAAGNVPFAEIAKKAGVSQKEAGAWILEMKRKGVLNYTDATVGSNTPGLVSLTAEATQLLGEWCKPFLRS